MTVDLAANKNATLRHRLLATGESPVRNPYLTLLAVSRLFRIVNMWQVAIMIALQLSPFDRELRITKV
jgi:hypothetical protein